MLFLFLDFGNQPGIPGENGKTSNLNPLLPVIHNHLLPITLNPQPSSLHPKPCRSKLRRTSGLSRGEDWSVMDDESLVAAIRKQVEGQACGEEVAEGHIDWGDLLPTAEFLEAVQRWVDLCSMLENVRGICFWWQKLRKSRNMFLQ
jgi:hypothetical protein